VYERSSNREIATVFTSFLLLRLHRRAGSGAAALAFVILIGGSAVAAAQESVLHSFGGGARNPYAGLIADANGVLYGTTANGGFGAGFGTVFALSPPASGGTHWTETVLHRFGGRDGLNPRAGLISDANGVLYGTTAIGGDDDNGTVFALAPPAAGKTRWTHRVLHHFRGARDGSFPEAGLIADANGVLYGTTANGGFGAGFGTVFALSPPASGETRWTHRVLYRFRGDRDGRGPVAGLIADANGVLYGTTVSGGFVPSGGGFGTVFALSPPVSGETRWTHRVLYRFGFRGDGDGGFPYAGLIADANGVLYGTTASGGESNRGTVFALAPPAPGETRWTETVLYPFRGNRDGQFPYAGLIADANGVLYGTTASGGDGDRGTIFALAPPAPGETRWRETVLHRFGRSHGRDGRNPYAGLIADANGVLYGTTVNGGGNFDRGGTVFALRLATGELF
jgi:uncharacterized repeat protein (TIGR03803 family)